MRLSWMSNVLLVAGIAMLAAFAVLYVVGIESDPLLPASSAFFIGCTAVLDRVLPERVQ